MKGQAGPPGRVVTARLVRRSLGEGGCGSRRVIGGLSPLPLRGGVGGGGWLKHSGAWHAPPRLASLGTLPALASLAGEGFNSPVKQLTQHVIHGLAVLLHRRRRGLRGGRRRGLLRRLRLRRGGRDTAALRAAGCAATQSAEQAAQ